MKRALVLAVGRQKEPVYREACADYARRCLRSLPLELREVRDLRALQAALPERALVVALDERGQQLTSRAFADWLRRFLEGPLPDLVFCVGGAEGLNDELRQRAQLVLSLGRMTLAHRVARLVLVEQIYRAVSIIEGAPYHRD